MHIWFVAYNSWVYKACFNVINVRVNRVSMILSHRHSAITGLHCYISPKWMYKSAFLRKKQMPCLLPHPKHECQQSVSDVWHCVMKHSAGWGGTVSHNRTIGCLSINNAHSNISPMSQKWASTEHQQFLALHCGICMGCAARVLHNRAIGFTSRQKLLQQHCYYVLPMTVHRASTTFSLVSCRIRGLSRWHCAIKRLSAAILGEKDCDDTATMS